MITRALLEGSIKGVGKFHRTAVFPCQIFQCMKGVNRQPGDPNYDLFQLALKSTALRLYPNYCNVDWSVNAGYDKNDPKQYVSTMGLGILAHLKSFEYSRKRDKRLGPVKDETVRPCRVSTIHHGVEIGMSTISKRKTLKI